MDSKHSTEHSKRHRILSQKGMEYRKSTFTKLLNNQEESWQEVESLLLRICDKETDILHLREKEKQFQLKQERYRSAVMELHSFLSRDGDKGSEKELEEQNTISEIRNSKLEQATKTLDSNMQELLEVVSSKSAKSSNSSVLAHKLAKAEAARARVAFAIKESDIKKQQAQLAAELDLMKVKSDLAVAEAEFNALKHSEDDDVSSQRSNLNMPFETSLQKSSRYVLHQTTPEFKEKPVSIAGNEQDRGHVRTNLNPFSSEFIPKLEQQPNLQMPHSETTSVASELTRFLLRKELLITRLTQFSDRPETYITWKDGFKSTVHELGVTPVEELDLLIRWLGPESTRHAASLRASNSSNPAVGLERVWHRLDERYGSPEVIEAALRSKLRKFPRLSNYDNKLLFDLSDIVSEIESIKEDGRYSQVLAAFDSSAGVRPIIDKLPNSLQERWMNEALRYKKQHGVSFPPFVFLANFLREVSKDRNDPSFMKEDTSSSNALTHFRQNTPYNRKMNISSKKTDVSDVHNPLKERCPLHKSLHSLNQCKAFRSKPLKERKELIRKFRYCYRCCATGQHIAKYCKEILKCEVCDMSNHPTALHVTNINNKVSTTPSIQGGEETIEQTHVKSVCSQVCGSGFYGKSCSKIILAHVYPKDNPTKSMRVYVVLDDQSNASLGKPELFNMLELSSIHVSYSLSSCTGRVNTSGRRASGIVIESMDGSTKLTLSSLIECNNIPNVREEIPTPQVADNFQHLQSIRNFIPPLDDKAEILLLIGRDLIEAHHVSDQKIGPKNAPFGQKLPLGWVIVGQACLGEVHQPDVVNVNKTQVLRNGRPTIFEPCPNTIHVRENLNTIFSTTKNADIGEKIFERTHLDDKQGMSQEDNKFMESMNSMKKDTKGNWVAPLPFRSNRQRLPNNRTHALKRAHALKSSLIRNSQKKEHFFAFMKRMLDNGHAELAPPMEPHEESWYLPIFGVYHPRKKNEIRVVFDSSAMFENVSLNKVLMTGPDLTNSLLGILMRFRREKVAITVDIEQMFYCFFVNEDQRNFLRFLWHQDNDISKPLVDYRMCVHVFGNSPSPAIATYGLRKTAELGESKFGSDTKNFVHNDFYVDDGVTSVATSNQAIDLLTRTRQSLKMFGNLRLHKITSNDVKVMNAFPTSDLAKNLRNLDIGVDNLPMQRSLGLVWDLETDSLKFQVNLQDKPYTRRGILSTVNSIFDPLGFASPVTIKGKLLLRDLISNTKDWDEPLAQDREEDWNRWKQSIKHLEILQIPRTYTDTSPIEHHTKEIHMFSDASEKAVAAVGYLKTIDKDGNHTWSFILGKAKVAPISAHTVPRLELCAAVLSVEIFDNIIDNLNIQHTNVAFHTDSKIVLGYISNQTRRFNVYISNRIARILRSSTPQQWLFVSTQQNPADEATRPIDSKFLAASPWLTGPCKTELVFEVVSEILPSYNIQSEEVVSLSTAVNPSGLGSTRFEKFSSWNRLVRAIANLKQICRNFRQSTCRGWHISTSCLSVELTKEAEKHIIKVVQLETYHQEIDLLNAKKPLLRKSSILSLNPYIDHDGLLRVGGRLGMAKMNDSMKHPLIIPGHSYIARLLILHHHEQVQHQGRHLTEGAVRAAGLWIVGGKRHICSILHKCFKCRKLRGRQETQLMSSLPTCRLEPAPPFSFVGVDVFGPWNIITRKTRGGAANAKRWAVIFTCLNTRAIHLEVIEEMSSSSFINSLRRFVAIRGNVTEFRSDRGTNFVGATDDLKINVINVESDPTKTFLHDKGTTWIFNPPHASHMGGVWERLIGVTRRILDSMLSEASGKILTHEVLSTFLAEASAIVNARPIVPVSTDPESPQILSPATLLTQKTNHVTKQLGHQDIKELYKVQWRRVQALANTFWKRWRGEYLSNLQHRHKWQSDRPNIREGDVVLLKEKDTHRNEWPMGVIVRAFPGIDKKVRSAEIRVIKEKKLSYLIRPISELIVLLSV